MAALKGNWNYPTSIRFGAGRIAELPDACRSLGMARPLLVTGFEPFGAHRENPSEQVARALASRPGVVGRSMESP